MSEDVSYFHPQLCFFTDFLPGFFVHLQQQGEYCLAWVKCRPLPDVETYHYMTEHCLDGVKSIQSVCFIRYKYLIPQWWSRHTRASYRIVIYLCISYLTFPMLLLTQLLAFFQVPGQVLMKWPGQELHPGPPVSGQTLSHSYSLSLCPHVSHRITYNTTLITFLRNCNDTFCVTDKENVCTKRCK